MVLRPILDSDQPSEADRLPAWDAVERRQTQRAQAWWLVSQPDHAAVSGQIAARFGASGFPQVPPEIVRAIALHDSGWSLFESDAHAQPQLHPDGRPVSFFEVEPDTFLRAWTASIDRVAHDSAVGGYMVSQHFEALGKFRIARDQDPPDVRMRLIRFVDTQRRQRELWIHDAGDSLSWDSWLPVLQFCDIFSLYVCSGTPEPVEFPQEFSGRRILARLDDGVVRLHPNPLKVLVDVEFPARRFPPSDSKITSIRVAIR